MNNILKDVVEFLNKVPNRKYGDNYLLASRLEKLLKVLPEVKKVLVTIKTDAAWALAGKWTVDYHNDKSMEGFTSQIELIDSALSKLKEL